MRLIRFLLYLFVVAICVGLLRTALPEAWWDRLVLPYRLARLSMEPADTMLPMPVEGVSVQKVRNTWHAPRGADRLHEGQDIFAPRGTKVFSATRGIVMRKGNSEIGGLTVSVVGPGRRTYYYAHLDAHAEIETGRLVTPGTVLGYVGTTGNARGTPPHLHFGVYTATGALDPLPLLVEPPPEISALRM